MSAHGATRGGAPQRIGHVTLAQCSRSQIRALAFTVNVCDLAESETPYEFEQRTAILTSWVRSVPPKWRKLYADQMSMRWAWLRVRDDLRKAGVLKPKGASDG